MRETISSFLRPTNKTYKYFSASAVRIINLSSSLASPFPRHVGGFVVSTRFSRDSKNKEAAAPCRPVLSDLQSHLHRRCSSSSIASASYKLATKGSGHISNITIIDSLNNSVRFLCKVLKTWDVVCTLSPSPGQRMEGSWFLVKVGNIYRTTRYIPQHNDGFILSTIPVLN
jgi:hypothetical protein